MGFETRSRKASHRRGAEAQSFENMRVLLRLSASPLYMQQDITDINHCELLTPGRDSRQARFR